MRVSFNLFTDFLTLLRFNTLRKNVQSLHTAESHLN